MKNRNEIVDARTYTAMQAQQSGIAQIIASIPLLIYKAFLFLLLALVAVQVGARYFPRTGLADFAQGFTVWLVRVLVVSGAMIGVKLAYTFYIMWHDIRLKNAEYTSARLKNEKLALQNQKLRTQIDLTANLPALMQYAMQSGHNIKFEGLEIASPYSNIHTLANGAQALALGAPIVDVLPEPFKLSDTLQNWQPTKDGILLAKRGSELVTVPTGEGLCHTIFVGSTDAGKTNNERAIMIQLLALGEKVYLCDRNYQRYRVDKKLGCVYDYAPIAALLAHEPIDSAAQALALLIYLYKELESRRAQRRHNLVQFQDIYLVMDELPAFCSEEPDIMQYVGRFLRESRQYGIFFIGAAQDVLNATLNNDNGAVRDNILTSVYGGGDTTTARKLLNLAKGESIDETGLGKKGVVYLRAKGADLEHAKVRCAYSDELATTMLLEDRAQHATQRAGRNTGNISPMVAPFLVQEVQTPARRDLATLDDAITVWNDLGEMGRPRLAKELRARGLECTDDRAKKLIDAIKSKVGGGGVQSA